MNCVSTEDNAKQRIVLASVRVETQFIASLKGRDTIHCALER